MMTFNRLLISVIATTALGGAGYGLYALGMKRGMGMTSTPATAMAPSHESGEDATRRHIATGIKAGDVDPATGRRVLYYQDPMMPGNQFDKPGKSPYMDMMLSPVYAEGEGDNSKVTVSPRIQQNLGLRTATVVEGTLSPQLAAVGTIAYNERDQVIVQARTTSYVERLFVRATLDRVGKGQPLAELHVPEWVAAQEEFLALRRMKGPDLVALVDAARQRMRQTGMSESQIARVEESGETQPRITVLAPMAGVVTELMLREGMTVMAGATMFRINALGTVWANAEVPESQAALLRPGTRMRASSPGVPGATFDGRVQAVLPEVNPSTRTLKARVELANPGGRLVPGMFVQMSFLDRHGEKALLIPTEAVVQTGQRTVVILAEDNGRFRPVKVEIGIESEGQTEIKRGLSAGQRVVVSSQFLIDSEASLKGVEARLNLAAGPGAIESTQRHQGEATVERIGRDALTLSHGPIDSLKWGPMTMDFMLRQGGQAALPRGLAAGDRIAFEFYQDSDSLAYLTSIRRLAPEPGRPATRASGSRP